MKKQKGGSLVCSCKSKIERKDDKSKKTEERKSFSNEKEGIYRSKRKIYLGSGGKTGLYNHV